MTIKIEMPRWLRVLLCRHDWRVYQHNVRAAENDRDVFVIAFKVCHKCAANRLIHLLE